MANPIIPKCSGIAGIVYKGQYYHGATTMISIGAGLTGTNTILYQLWICPTCGAVYGQTK